MKCYHFLFTNQVKLYFFFAGHTRDYLTVHYLKNIDLEGFGAGMSSFHTIFGPLIYNLQNNMENFLNNTVNK